MGLQNVSVEIKEEENGAELTLDGHLMRLCETAYERYVPLGFTNKDMGFGVSDIRGYTLVAPLTPLERGQT